jgi:hypothetical protein
MANLLDLSPDEFMFTLQEFGYAPDRRDELIRQYREHNSVFGALNRAAQERQAEIAGEGRRPVAGGFLSKPEGSLGMDAVRGLRVEPMAGLLGMLTGAGRAVEAPAAAYQGLIPMADVPLEALGTAGMASLGGAALTRPAGSVGMGGRVAAAEPRNAAERMARDILDMRAAGRAGEVTDEMMAQADPQEMFRLYQAGETGMVLPMDVQSRMRRAEDMGFDMMADLYHGSARDGFVDTTDIKAFDPSRVGDRWNADTQGFSMTTAQRDANYYAQPGDSAIRRGDFGDGVVYPLMDASQRPLQMRVGPLDGTISAWDDRPSDTYDVINRGGYDSARLNADGVEMRVVMDPRNIRSRFARFDPEFAHLANLSAANIDPLAGLFGALAAEEQRRQRNSQ